MQLDLMVRIKFEFPLENSIKIVISIETQTPDNYLFKIINGLNASI